MLNKNWIELILYKSRAKMQNISRFHPLKFVFYESYITETCLLFLSSSPLNMHPLSIILLKITKLSKKNQSADWSIVQFRVWWFIHWCPLCFSDSMLCFLDGGVINHDELVSWTHHLCITGRSKNKPTDALKQHVKNMVEQVGPTAVDRTSPLNLLLKMNGSGI